MLTSFDGVTLHYETYGSGRPVVLLHSLGFCGDLWSEMGVVSALVESGRSVVVPDARGHGRSGRPYDPAVYGAEAMARDVSALLDTLDTAHVDLAAYSMGSYIGLRVLQTEARIARAVLGGVGAAALQSRRADASQFPVSPNAEEASTWLLGHFPYLRGRVERGATDARALVAVLQAGTRPGDTDLSSVTAAVLLLCGTEDDDPEPLAALIPDSRVVRLEVDHASTMNHPDFTPTLVSFLNKTS